MPSENQSASNADYPEWSERMAEEIGENPVRFLDADVDELDAAKAVIQGMFRLDRIAVWETAERRLGKNDGDPRDGIIDLLEERREFLLENGERPDLLDVDSIEDLPDRYQPAARPDPDDVETVVTWEGQEERPESASSKINSGLTDS